MNPDEQAARILNTRTLTSVVEIYDDVPYGECLEVIVRNPEGNVICTMTICDYDAVDEFSKGVLRNWED